MAMRTAWNNARLIKDHGVTVEHEGRAIAIEVKKLDLETGIFEGLASKFGNIDSHQDIMMPGAFGNIVAKNIRMLAHHDTRYPIGVWLEIRVTEAGLWVKGQLSIGKSVPKADEMYSLLKDGAIDGLSIGFQGIDYTEDVETHKGKELVIRRWNKVKLMEISLVTFPSNPDTRTGKVKSKPTKIAHEKALRALGYTAKDAKCATHAAFKALERNAKATTSQADLIAELVDTQKANTQAFSQIATLIQNLDKELRSNAHHRENKRPA